MYNKIWVQTIVSDYSLFSFTDYTDPITWYYWKNSNSQTMYFMGSELFPGWMLLWEWFSCCFCTAVSYCSLIPFWKRPPAGMVLNCARGCGRCD